MSERVLVCAICCDELTCRWLYPNANGVYTIVCDNCGRENEGHEEWFI